jgi:uncharacterized protein with GYD domain
MTTVRRFSTYIILSDIGSRWASSPAKLRGFWSSAQDRIEAECPSVTRRYQFATTGRFDAVDVLAGELTEVQDAAVIIRGAGRVKTETLIAADSSVIDTTAGEPPRTESAYIILSRFSGNVEDPETSRLKLKTPLLSRERTLEDLEDERDRLSLFLPPTATHEVYLTPFGRFDVIDIIALSQSRQLNRAYLSPDERNDVDHVRRAVLGRVKTIREATGASTETLVAYPMRDFLDNLSPPPWLQVHEERLRFRRGTGSSEN